jgi:hypothetical protein
MPVEADRTPRPGDREPRVALEPRAEPAHQELERGGAVGVADEPVREGVCCTVERAGCRDAEVRQSGSAESSTSADPPGCSTCRRVIPRRPPRSARGVPARAGPARRSRGPTCAPSCCRSGASRQGSTGDRPRPKAPASATAPAGTRVRGASRRGTSNGQSSLTR